MVQESSISHRIHGTGIFRYLHCYITDEWLMLIMHVGKMYQLMVWVGGLGTGGLDSWDARMEPQANFNMSSLLSKQLSLTKLIQQIVCHPKSFSEKVAYTFGLSEWEIFWPLLAGATLILAPPGGVTRGMMEGWGGLGFVPTCQAL